MKRRRTGAIALGLIAVITGCKPTVQGGGGGETSPEEACAKVANALCAREFAVCPTDVESAPSALACAQRETEVCVESLDLPGAVFDVDAELRCAAAIPTFDCGELWSPTPACPLRRGTHPPGEACVEGLQCTTGVCSGFVSECGKCMSIASEGQPCDNSYYADAGGTVCDKDLFCAGSPLRCMKLGVPGAACSADEPCGAFLVCEHGACGPAGEGAPCDPSASACDPEENLVCDLDSKTCKKDHVTKPVGCFKDGCPPDEYCDGTSPKPVCRKETPEGGNCDGNHFICVWPSWCDQGRCSSAPIACE
jgi:hypothetical protein